jgi:hypothetical protein
MNPTENSLLALPSQLSGQQEEERNAKRSGVAGHSGSLADVVVAGACCSATCELGVDRCPRASTRGRQQGLRQDKVRAAAARCCCGFSSRAIRSMSCGPLRHNDRMPNRPHNRRHIHAAQCTLATAAKLAHACCSFSSAAAQPPPPLAAEAASLSVARYGVAATSLPKEGLAIFAGGGWDGVLCMHSTGIMVLLALGGCNSMTEVA